MAHALPTTDDTAATALARPAEVIAHPNRLYPPDAAPETPDAA